ncbi:hypothetical protein PIB30_072087 [Stylosanthes scabra]|uniref:Uncharacterized protein n=1 Tax=Stylosanthes scabra TaxID=79078 RepID=A0ABU6RPD6_9FABA|nr:hypothetical protein [Stylosanthes scabra]
MEMKRRVETTTTYGEWALTGNQAEQVEFVTLSQQIKAGNQGIAAEMIEEVLEKTIRKVIKGKAVDMDIDVGPDPTKQAEGYSDDFAKMETQPKETKQANLKMGDQQSDESTSQTHPDLNGKDRETIESQRL